MIDKRKIRRPHPGKYIKDALEALNMTSKEFALRTGISERTISDVINEKGNITFDIASKLASFFGSSINLWVNMQTAYDEYVLEATKEKEIEEDYQTIKEYKKYFLENGFIDSNDNHKTFVEKIKSKLQINRLTFLQSENSFASLKETNNCLTANDLVAQNIWISYALTEARKRTVQPYDREKLLNSLVALRSLILKKPQVFYPEIVDILSQCGVSFVIVPYLSKSNIYGATKWLSSNIVMLAMSNKQERADMFWFTLFHEISHVLLEHKRYMILNQDGVDDKEADLLAKNILISDDYWNEFVQVGDFAPKAIINFAKKLSILPCIVLGRLHKEFPKMKYSSIDRELNAYYRYEDFGIA